jgi:hypothetical protein
MIKITTPSSYHVPANKLFELTVTTINGHEGINGFYFPPIANVGMQKIWFREYAAAGQAVRASKLLKFPLMGPDYTHFDVTSMIKNAGEKSIYHVRFKPKTQHAANWKLKLYFRTRTLDGEMSLFANDLGSGIANGQPIFCKNYANMNNIVCKLFHGDQIRAYDSTDAYVEITWTGNLATNVRYEFQIYEITNPPTFSDKRKIILKMEGINNSGAIINTGEFYDFTLMK